MTHEIYFTEILYVNANNRSEERGKQGVCGISRIGIYNGHSE